MTSIDGISAHDLISSDVTRARTFGRRKVGAPIRAPLLYGAPRSICGRMSLAQPIEFRKGKAESKEMR